MSAPHLVASAIVAAALGTGHPAIGQRPVLVHGVGAVGITVRDAARSAAFYESVLSFRLVTDTEVWGTSYEQLEGVFGCHMRVQRLRLGDEEIELTQYLTPQGRSIGETTRSQDRSFQHIAIVVRDMDSAFAVLRSRGVTFVSTMPQVLPSSNPAAGGISAFYFKDPDGHVLELLHFPPDKGRAKWHAPTAALFLGIDHTAIVVRDTRKSLAFYRDVLGLSVSGHSDNSGTEQAHLNLVSHAHVRITSLRAGDGPGIEFLQYLTPRDGRPMPADVRSNDILHWQTALRTSDIAATARALSRRPIAVDPALGFSQGFLVPDPDGHIMEIEE